MTIKAKSSTSKRKRELRGPEDEMEFDQGRIASGSRSSKGQRRKKKKQVEEVKEEVYEPGDGLKAKTSRRRTKPTEEEATETAAPKHRRKKRQSPNDKLKVRASNLKEKVEGSVSEMETKLKEHEQLKQDGAYFSDNTWLDTYSLMFRKLKRIMRKVEVKVMDTSSGNDIYALMALYNQMREVINDLRAMIDLSQNTQRIIDNVLYPFTRDVANNYADVIFLMQKNLRLSVEGEVYKELKTSFDKSLSEHAKFIQGSYEKHSEVLKNLLEE